MLLNWPIIKEPLNWIIILLMVAIGGFAFEEILRFAGAGEPGSDCGCHRQLFPVNNSES